MLTAERLKQVLQYDSNTGEWTWLIRRGWYPIGSPGGWFNNGYRMIRVDGRVYKSARLAVLYMTGQWPAADVDHEDTDQSNDVWDNLRVANQSQNNANQRRLKRNRSGFKGVSWHAGGGRWQACICVNRQRRHLGYFDQPELAHAAYMAAAREAFGEFARAA